jgi:hypothetical protein
VRDDAVTLAGFHNSYAVDAMELQMEWRAGRGAPAGGEAVTL